MTIETNKVKVVAPGLTGHHMKMWLNGVEVRHLTKVSIELPVEGWNEVTMTFLAEVEAEVEAATVWIDGLEYVRVDKVEVA